MDNEMKETIEKVQSNREAIIRIEGKLENICSEVLTIKNNHLVHIQDSLDMLSEKVMEINLKGAGQTPTIVMLQDIGKYIIIAIVGAIIALIIKNGGI